MKKLLKKIFRPNKTGSPYRVYKSIHSSRRKAGIGFFLWRAVFRTVSKTQHKEIKPIGIQNIPPDGSVILVGNHPNSFMDFFNLLTVVRHPIATAAKDTITDAPLIGPSLRHHALFIPISRRQDHEGSNDERKKANEEAMQELTDHLVAGRLFNIYAEGRSTDSRKLNKIKPGFMLAVFNAEKQFNFKLHLKIVPYGYYYDRINKFQSSVCIIFGKPFRIRDIVSLPDDYKSLSEKEKSNLEKKVLIEGKKRVQQDIENLIISIHDQGLIGVIDDATSVYVLTPVKYMGPHQNIREKYNLSKLIADAFQGARQTERGRDLLESLRSSLKDYRAELKKNRIPDAIVRRELSTAAMGFGISGILRGLFFMPLILIGSVTSFIPRRIAGLLRRYATEIRKLPLVDGDEKAAIGGFSASLVVYPAWGVLSWYILDRYLPGLLQEIEAYGAGLSAFYHPAAAVVLAFITVWLLIRLWRFSVKESRRFKDSLRWLFDVIYEGFHSKKVKELREKRYALIDQIDSIIEDYSGGFADPLA